jgi:hypothetical protein
MTKEREARDGQVEEPEVADMGTAMRSENMSF